MQSPQFSQILLEIFTEMTVKFLIRRLSDFVKTIRTSQEQIDAVETVLIDDSADNEVLSSLELRYRDEIEVAVGDLIEKLNSLQKGRVPLPVIIWVTLREGACFSVYLVVLVFQSNVEQRHQEPD
jgi:hypothetical protein